MFSHPCGFFYPLFLNWRIIALRCSAGLCHAFVWLSRRCTSVPSLRLPPTPPHPARWSQSPGLSSLCSCDQRYHAVTMMWPRGPWVVSWGSQNFSSHSTSRGCHLKAVISHRTFPAFGAFTWRTCDQTHCENYILQGKPSDTGIPPKSLGFKIRPGQKD